MVVRQFLLHLELEPPTSQGQHLQPPSRQAIQHHPIQSHAGARLAIQGKGWTTAHQHLALPDRARWAADAVSHRAGCPLQMQHHCSACQRASRLTHRRQRYGAGAQHILADEFQHPALL